MPEQRGPCQGERGLCHKACPMEWWLFEPGIDGVLPTACCPPWGRPAWLHGCHGWCGRGHGPRAVWRDRSRTHLLGLGGRTRPLRQRLLHGHWGAPSAGGPKEKERGVAAARAPSRLSINLVEQPCFNMYGPAPRGPGGVRNGVSEGGVRPPSTPTYQSRLRMAGGEGLGEWGCRKYATCRAS